LTHGLIDSAFDLLLLVRCQLTRTFPIVLIHRLAISLTITCLALTLTFALALTLSVIVRQ
jgi:hypothetical protein